MATILCVSACFVHAATSAEEFCDEVKKALSSSKKFSEWRGKVTTEREWVSLYSLPGFDDCHIVQLSLGSFNLRCVRGWWLELKPASFEYDQVRKIVEECLPKPNWVHNQKNDPLPSQSFINPNGENASISIVKIQAPFFPNAPKSSDIYQTHLFIFEQF